MATWRALSCGARGRLQFCDCAKIVFLKSIAYAIYGDIIVRLTVFVKTRERIFVEDVDQGKENNGY